MSRTIGMIVAIFVGLIIGNIVAGFAMTIITVIAAPNAAFRVPALLIGSALGAGLGYLRWRNQQQGVISDAHGSARFSLQNEEKRTVGGGEGLIVGRSAKGWLMRYAGPAHLLTIAPTRSGKGVGAIIPNLLTADRSVLCIDPKGENARITARARSRMGPVFVLDPFEVSGQPSAAFNPLSALDETSIDLAEDAALIAEALVYDPPHQVSEAHWNEEAKALIAGLILHVVTTQAPPLRSLTTVRDLLTGAPESLQKLLKTMQASGAAGGLVARAANRQLAKSDREATGVLSAAQRHTHFLDSPRMSRVSERSDFAFADLKAGVVSVFLVLPPERLGTHARWLRLLVVQAIGALARAPQSGAADAKPVLLMLDEFAALDRLEPVERAFGLMAGYGVQLWAILQDLHQLKSVYGERAGTFLANAGVIQVFNVADVETATWVSRSLGTATQAYYTSGQTTTSSPGQWSNSYGSSTNLNFAKRDLATPDEVMRIDDDCLILLRPGQNPTVARKVRYYVDREFGGLFAD
jgi:type IV secretion system protein VirD4